MVTVVQIRPGVEFIPDAANAFRRAEAQVQKEFGRNIDVNSTFRSWDTQMRMYNAWNAYVNGTGPHPGHSRAIHPKYSRHTGGTALDSDDWHSARIRTILAENGFIRNQLHVPNEQHHFEYIRSRDTNHGKPVSGGSSSGSTPIDIQEDDMIFLYIDNDGSGKRAWVLLNTKTTKHVWTNDQDKANGWALAWGNARSNKGQPIPRQQFLNAIDAIQKTI